MYNHVIAALRALGLADDFGDSRIPLHVLNCVYPLVPDELAEFCRDKRAVLVIEEGQPNFIENDLKAILSDAGVVTKVSGKNCLPMAGEYVAAVLIDGFNKFFSNARPKEIGGYAATELLKSIQANQRKALDILGEPVPARPPGFCTGCPERPVFGAIKLVQEQVGKVHSERRHRLPQLRDTRALQDWQHHSRLRPWPCVLHRSFINDEEPCRQHHG